MIITIIFAVILCASYVCYRIAFYSGNKTHNDVMSVPSGKQYAAISGEISEAVSALAVLPFERVYITSHDGLLLSARYYHKNDGAPIALCFHGYRSSGLRDLSCGAMICMEQGLNVLLVDQRAHSMSGGHTITFGAKEKFDCLDWIGYCRFRFGDDVKIFLLGVSMGASTVLMAAGLGLPGNICAIIADCPFSSSKAIIQKVCCDKKIPFPGVYPFLFLGALVFGHFIIGKDEVSDAINKSSIPIFIIHGEDDRFVPCEMSMQLKTNFGDRLKLETFPGAGHGISYFTDRKRYTKIIADIIASYK